MPRFCFASLRVRLTLLVLLAVLPALGLTLYAYLEQRRLQRVHVQEQARLLVRVATSYQDRLIEGARQLLTALAQLPQVRGGDPAVCNALFADLLKRYSLYANLGATKRDGDVFCSAVPTKSSNHSDRLWFQRAVKNRNFVVGVYQIGRIVNKPVLIFGYPVLDTAGQVQSVVYASLDLAWLNQFVTQVKLPEKASLIVVDRNGTILAHQPDPEKWVGKTMPMGPIVKTILAEGEGVTEVYDTDGIPRLYAITQMGDSADANVYMAIGISQANPFAEANRTLLCNLTGLGLIAASAITAFWVGGELFLLRPLNKLVSSAKRIAAGDLSTRTGLSQGPGELSQLSLAFDNMVESLQRHSYERQQVEAELRRANERFQFAAAAHRSIIYEWDIEKNTIERTQGFIDVLGYSLEEAQPTPQWWFECIHPDDRQRVRDQFAADLENSILDFAIEYRICHKDNQYLYVWEKGLIVRNVDGRAERVIASIIDISDRKRAEEERTQLLAREQQARVQAEVAQQRFLDIVQGLDAIITEADAVTWKFSFVSQRAEALLGYPVERWLTEPDFWVSLVHPDDLEEAAAFCKAATAQGKSHLFEYRVLAADGRIVWIRDFGRVILDDEDRPLRLHDLMVDITEQKRAEAEIRQLNETLEQRVLERTAQLETANKELDSFSYSVSHDLRAPLRHVRGFIDALAKQLKRSGVSADPQVAHYIEIIQDSNQKMGQMIESLLTLSRLGRQQLASQPVNLRQLVETAIAFVMSETEIREDRPIEFIIGDLPTVIGDPTLLQQVVTNLIDNAVKFSRVSVALPKEAHHPARIEIGTLPDGTIFVKDNGVGFQMEYADKLFGAFQRLHSQRQFNGTGIGLAIVQRIIHRHGGTIWVESQPNQGATFYFKLRSEEAL